VDAAELGADDTVLEVGAGPGTLTEVLAERARRVVAVELDEQLLPTLRSRMAHCRNVEVVAGDILAHSIPGLLRQEGGQPTPPYKVVANLPYYITSAVLRHLLEATVRAQLIVVMVQREVAQRIVAKPGQMSLLAVSVRFFASPSLVARVPARAFYPVPKVSSAILRIEPHAQLPLGDDEIPAFFRIVRAGFAQRRKQLRNALRHGLATTAEAVASATRAAGIDERRRAQSLDVDEWLALFRAFQKVARDSLR
jgi:16S rRNA (adenine1518-N6/adenine1519-N6)-dimethyltransferase